LSIRRDIFEETDRLLGECSNNIVDGKQPDIIAFRRGFLDGSFESTPTKQRVPVLWIAAVVWRPAYGRCLVLELAEDLVSNRLLTELRFPDTSVSPAVGATISIS